MARRRWNIETIQQVVNGDKPFIQVGYSGKSKLRKNGDIWVDVKGIKWKKENRIPYYQNGRRILYKKSELLQALRKNNHLIEN